MTAEALATQRRAEAHLVDLAVLTARGEGNSESARRLRGGLTDLEPELTEEAVSFLRELSSDLYALEDDEIYDPPRFANAVALMRALTEQYANGQWHELLRTLRQDAPGLPRFVRPFMRARAYSKIGSDAAAWAFYQSAAAVDENNLVHRFAALESLSKWAPSRAGIQASRYVADAESHPALRLLSASILLSSYTADVGGHAADIRELALVILGALGSARGRPDVPRQVLDAGYASLATCLEILGDYANAAFVLRRVVGTDPFMERHIASLDEKCARGLSSDSGVLIAPALAVREPERVDTFERAMRARLEDAAAVRS
jgi:tetratricopeptide (TPR) repeat protein